MGSCDPDSRSHEFNVLYEDTSVLLLAGVEDDEGTSISLMLGVMSSLNGVCTDEGGGVVTNEAFPMEISIVSDDWRGGSCIPGDSKSGSFLRGDSSYCIPSMNRINITREHFQTSLTFFKLKCFIRRQRSLSNGME